MERKWGNGERLTLYISSFSLYFLPLSPFPPSLSISYIKMHHILLQNVKYGTFVANVTKISTYALWGNNSGSNLLRGSSAIRAGLLWFMWIQLMLPVYSQNITKNRTGHRMHVEGIQICQINGWNNSFQNNYSMKGKSWPFGQENWFCAKKPLKNGHFCVHESELPDFGRTWTPNPWHPYVLRIQKM